MRLAVSVRPALNLGLGGVVRRAGDVLRTLRRRLVHHRLVWPMVRLVHHRLVRPMVRLMHHRLGVPLGRLMVRRGLRAGLVMRRLVIRRMVRPGRRRRAIMLRRRRRRRAIVMPVRRRGRRSYVMHDSGIVVDQINVIGGNDTADKGNGHHTGNAGGDEAHRASFYKVVAFVSLS